MIREGHCSRSHCSRLPQACGAATYRLSRHAEDTEEGVRFQTLVWLHLAGHVLRSLVHRQVQLGFAEEAVLGG